MISNSRQESNRKAVRIFLCGVAAHRRRLQSQVSWIFDECFQILCKFWEIKAALATGYAGISSRHFTSPQQIRSTLFDLCRLKHVAMNKCPGKSRTNVKSETQEVADLLHEVP